MIDLKQLKSEAVKFPEPIKSIIEMSKNAMNEQEFVDWFVSLREKAREMDIKKKEEVR